MNDSKKKISQAKLLIWTFLYFYFLPSFFPSFYLSFSGIVIILLFLDFFTLRLLHAGHKMSLKDNLVYQASMKDHAAGSIQDGKMYRHSQGDYSLTEDKK